MGAGAFACARQSTVTGAPTGTPLISSFAYVGSGSGPLRSICTVSAFASVRTTSVAGSPGRTLRTPKAASTPSTRTTACARHGLLAERQRGDACDVRARRERGRRRPGELVRARAQGERVRVAEGRLHARRRPLRRDALSGLEDLERDVRGAGQREAEPGGRAPGRDAHRRERRMVAGEGRAARAGLETAEEGAAAGVRPAGARQQAEPGDSRQAEQAGARPAPAEMVAQQRHLGSVASPPDL